MDNDRKMRTFGWARACRPHRRKLGRQHAHPAAGLTVTESTFLADQKIRGQAPSVTRKLGVQIEPWTPADCLLSWWHLAQFFATDGTRELISWRNATRPQAGRPEAPRPSSSWKDDAASVVQPDDVSAEWRRQVREFEVLHGFNKGQRGAGEDGPKFSHAWVVGGKKTTTGSSVLVSDPQTPVRNPSLWMEFHVSGKTLNARGVGIPGSPGLLLGFNQRIAWGLTALGADQADLFRLKTDSDHKDQYQWNAQWRPMAVRQERIAVKGASEVNLAIRETHLGPVVSAFAFRQPGEPEVALKRIPMCETNRDTIQAVFAMMRATNAAQFARRARRLAISERELRV